MIKEIPSAARVYRLYAPNDLRFDSERLVPVPGDLLYQTHYTVISVGTEMAAFNGEPPLKSYIKQYPRLQGYCSAGKILGRFDANGILNTSDKDAGKTVVTGSSHRDYAILTDDKILAGLRSEDVRPEYALAYIYHLTLSCQIRLNARFGDRIIVYGSGLIAQAGIELLKYQGFNVAAVSNNKRRHNLLYESGADQVLTATECMKSKITSDIAIITSNSWDLWFCAMESCKFYGKIGLLGFPGRNNKVAPSINPLDPTLTYAKQLEVYFCGTLIDRIDSRMILRCTEQQNMQNLLELIDQNVLRPSRLISERLPMHELEYAYNRLSNREPAFNTVALSWAK